MSKLVDIEDAKKCADIAIKWGWSLPEFRENMDEWEDFVELVRCKDCKFNQGNYKCLYQDSIIQVPNDNDFCSYGKKRDEETTAPEAYQETEK